MKKAQKPFWISADGRTRIMRYCHGVFLLQHNGRSVLSGSFRRCANYAWAEFVDL
jgi:hypothetical protein